MKKSILFPLCLLPCLISAQVWFKQKKEEQLHYINTTQEDVDGPYGGQAEAPIKKPKILHLSFHLGCIKEVEHIARALDLDVTPWYIFAQPLTEFEGVNSGFEIYNMLPDRAQRIWEKHKDYFNTFDMVWITDTAALSRVFLQNNWEKPLLIWVCNRFDYCHYPSKFPDPAYHEMFQAATKKKNVFIIPYAPYEWYYAYTKGVYLNTFTIKPIGAINYTDAHKRSDKAVPETVDKKNTLFIYPRLNDRELSFVKHKCTELDIAHYSGTYDGVNDIADFKGVIFFIYGAWSNIAMFENFQRGIVHFLPSIEFMEGLNKHGAPVSGHPYVLSSKLYELCEWYTSDHKDLIVYYDSWKDLKHKIETTDYDAMRARIIDFAKRHEQEMLARWRQVFEEIYQQL